GQVHIWPYPTRLLRIAVLSSRAHLASEMPYFLFGDERCGPDYAAMREFIASASSEEIFALFQNPKIAGKALADRSWPRASAASARIWGPGSGRTGYGRRSPGRSAARRHRSAEADGTPAGTDHRRTRLSGE